MKKENQFSGAFVMFSCKPKVDSIRSTNVVAPICHTRNTVVRRRPEQIIIIMYICKEKTKWNTQHAFWMCLSKEETTKLEGKLNNVKINSLSLKSIDMSHHINL